MSKQKLIFITKYPFPWMGVPFLYNILPMLSHKCDTTILSGDRGNKTWNGISIVGCGRTPNIPIIKELIFSINICKFLLSNSKSVDHAYVYNDHFVAIIYGIMVAMLNLRRDRKIRIYFHIESKWFSKISELISRMLVYSLNNFYDRIFVFDELLEKYLMTRGLNNNKISIIYTGVNRDYFKYKPFEQHNLIVVYVGTLSKRRKLDIILGAFKRLIVNIPTAELYIVGDGPDKERLIHTVERLNINKNVIFTGLIDHSRVSEYINMSTICLAMYPKKEYDIQFPFKIFEYMACRKPVITTNTTSTSRYLMHDKDAILIEFKEKDITDSIMKLWNDKNLRDNLVTNGEIFVEKFKWDDVYSKIVQTIYENS